MLDVNTAAIGKIVKSNTHVDYICQINGPNEQSYTPEPTDYSFGTFVSIQLENTNGGVERLIGVIYNTLLMNPEFGTLGPRLSPPSELEVFAPDYLAETATLVGIIMLGWYDTVGDYYQGIPALAATVNSAVHTLDQQELYNFHCDNEDQPCLRYMPILLAQRDPLVPQLLMAVLDRLGGIFPHSGRQLTVMRNNIAWKSIVQPAG